MRVIFFGTSAFAVPSLEQLIKAGHEIALCVTQPDRPRGRGLAVEPSPVKQAAQRLGVRLAQPERLDGSLIAPGASEVGVLASYGKLVPHEVLALPRHGLLGVHPSLLPKYRGAAPVAWAILSGERVTGVTIYRLNDRLDAGEMLLQERAAIAEGETAEALTERLARLGAECLVRAVGAIEAGRAVFTLQDEQHATFAPKLTKAQGRIDWRQPAEELERLVRALIPWPGAMAAWKRLPLKVWRVRAEAEEQREARLTPGTIVRVTEEAVLVQTGRGTLGLLEVQPAGRRRMSMREFLAGHPMRPGEMLDGVG